MMGPFNEWWSSKRRFPAELHKNRRLDGGTINKLKQKVNAVPRLDQQGSRTNINGGWIYLDQTSTKQAVQKRKSDRDGRCVCLSFTPTTL